MPPFRSFAAVLTVFALAGCATPSARPPSSATTAPQRSGPVSGPTVDIGSLRAAGAGLGVRPAFRSCVDAAGGDAAAIQRCIDTELQHQHSRVDAALAARRGRSNSNGDVDAVQAQWRSERDRMCGPDAPGVPAAQRVRAGICRLEATAARADVLSR